MKTKPFMKKSDCLNTERFEQISDNDFFGMVVCQRAIMLEQKAKEDEQNHRPETVADDRCVEQVTESLSTSVNSESAIADQDVFDAYEEVYDDENNTNGENVEIVTAEPVNNQESFESNVVTTSLVPICNDDTTSIDFSIFADESLFNNYMDCSNKTVIECVEAYIQCKSKSQGESKKVADQYRLLLKYLTQVETEFGIKLMPSVIGELFMVRFSNHIQRKGLAPNTIAGIIGQLKCVLRWARSYGAKISHELDNYKPKGGDLRTKIVLSEPDILKILYYNFDDKDYRPQLKNTLRKVRDHFVLSCYLGQRYSDSIRVDKRNFNGALNDEFTITQKKTGNRASLKFQEIYGEFPLFIKELLERYEYKAPWTGHLTNFNRYLKQLCKDAGLNKEYQGYKIDEDGRIVPKTYKQYELITSHCARRTFITNAVKRSVNIYRIKQASGHSSSRSFDKYVLL